MEGCGNEEMWRLLDPTNVITTMQTELIYESFHVASTMGRGFLRLGDVEESLLWGFEYKQRSKTSSSIDRILQPSS